VAAYNAGPGRVARSQGVPAIPETQAFVKNVMGSYTGLPPAALPEAKPQAEAKPAPQPKPRMAARPSLNDRILPTSPRPVPSEAEAEKPRPRPKIIEVRYPSAKQVAVAKPASAD